MGIKPQIGWAGISQPHKKEFISSGWRDWNGNDVNVMDIFTTKKEALKHFEEVVKVQIIHCKH